MKTKRLFLKLFLAVCFLMAVPAMRAEAAQSSYNIASGNILIKNNKIYQGTEPTIPDNKGETLSTTAYTITGSTSGNRSINIKGTSTDRLIVYLNFNKLNTMGDVQLNIEYAEVHITVDGKNSLMSSSNNAVNLKNNAHLYLSGTNSRLEIIGNSSTSEESSAVSADTTSSFTVESGRVVLIAGNGSNTQNVPFNGGGVLAIEDGTLECLKNGKPTDYGNGNVNQSGGIIKAEGLARVDLETEKIIGLKSDDYIFSLDTASGNPNDEDYNMTIPHPSQGITIQEDWLGKYLNIKPASSIAPGGTGSQLYTVKQVVYIPNRQPPITGNFTTKPETPSGAQNGSVSGLKANMQYSIDYGPNKEDYIKDGKLVWKDCTLENGSTTLTGLSAGTYRFRTNYVDSDNPKDRLFASKPSSNTATVKRGDILNASLKDEATEHVFQERSYQYNELPDPVIISLKNLDKQGPIRIDSLTIEDNAPEGKEAFQVLDDYTNVIGADSTNETYKIQPNTGLDAGEYTGSIIIKYTDRDGNIQKDPIILSDVLKFKVKKLPYKGDKLEVAPEFDSASFNSITLKPIVIEGNKKEFEYSKDNGKTWQKELTFTDLEADTEYKFTARFASETNYEASEWGPTSKEFKTEKKASIVYSTKELSLIPNRKYQISIDGNPENFDECTIGANGLLDIKDKWFGKTISLYDTDKKNTQTLKIPDIGKAPTSPKGQAESFSSAGDGKILGVTTSMEYKLKGSDDDWVTCPAKTIENLPAGTYLVRTKAVDEGTGENKKYTFASHATEVVIARGNALSISPETFDLGKSPYKVLPAAKAIAFRNHDKTEDITIKSIALSDESPFAILHKETDSAIVPAGKNNETFKIQPKPDLNVGTYTDEFVVTFEVGYNPDTSTGDNQIQAQAEGFNTDSPDTSGEKSASIPITFTVEKGTQEAPPVPAEKSVKSTSITLETIPNSAVSGAKAQYSKDGGKTWQDSPTFNKLKADTEYYFVSRYAATDNYNESEISNGENAITTAEKDDDKDDDNSGNKNVSSNANGSTGSNGSNGSGTNGSGTTGTNGNGTTGTNGTGTNGTNSGSGSNSSRLTSARTGDLNNIQLWVALMIGSYLSSYLIIKDRIKKAKVK